MSKPKQFYIKYWLDEGWFPSKSIIKLNWIKDGKLTKEGREAYRKLIYNIEK